MELNALKVLINTFVWQLTQLVIALLMHARQIVQSLQLTPCSRSSPGAHSASDTAKGPSIYDVHKKITFLTPSPSVDMRPHGPDPPSPLWMSTHGRHEIHTALLKWLVQ